MQDVVRDVDALIKAMIDVSLSKHGIQQRAVEEAERCVRKRRDLAVELVDMHEQSYASVARQVRAGLHARGLDDEEIDGLGVGQDSLRRDVRIARLGVG